MKGCQDLDTGLWRIILYSNNQKTQKSKAKNVYELSNTGALVKYLNKSLFMTIKSSVLKAIKSLLHNLSRSHGGLNQQTFENDTRNSLGSHEPKKSEYPLHQKRYKIRYIGWGSEPHWNKRENTFGMCSCDWSRLTLHGYKGKVSHKDQQEKILCNGMLLLQFQLHNFGANEIKINFRMVEILWGDLH